MPLDVNKHQLLAVFSKHLLEYTGIQGQARERGLGENVTIKLARMEKVPGECKVYSINTQMQWESEKGCLINGKGSLQGEFVNKN